MLYISISESQSWAPCWRQAVRLIALRRQWCCVRQVSRLKALAHFDLSDRPAKNIWLWRKTQTQGKVHLIPPAHAHMYSSCLCAFTQPVPIAGTQKPQVAGRRKISCQDGSVQDVCVCVRVCVRTYLFLTLSLTSLPLQLLRYFLMTFHVQLSCDPSIMKVKIKVPHTRRATAGLFNLCFSVLPEGHSGWIPLSAEQMHPVEITYLSFLNGYPNFTDSSWHHLVKQPHSSSFFPLFHPLWTSEHCDKHLNGCICSLLPSTTSWILNGSCLIYRCRMSGILQKTLRASWSLSVEGERQRLIWNSLYQSAHARISAIQQVIRNAKKTRGEWEYLRGKVTLGPPSVTAYAQRAPVCMENRHECRCIVICYCFFHSHTCFLVSSDTSYSLVTSKLSFLKHDWKCYLIAFFSNYFTNRGGMWMQFLTSLLFEAKQREWHPLVHSEHAARIYLTITQNQTAEIIFPIIWY